jgi:hypothetical protein
MGQIFSGADILELKSNGPHGDRICGIIGIKHIVVESATAKVRTGMIQKP